jgi:signal transduction histidine kinase
VSYVLNVAQAERDIRAAREAAERTAELRGRMLAALGREVEKVIGTIGSGSADAAPGVSEAAERLKTLLTRTKRASEVLTGEGAIASANFRTADLAAGAVERIRVARGPGEAARIRLAGALDREVTCDRGLVMEALAELLTNALIFSPTGAEVVLSVVAAGPDRVRFEIADRGAGIPEHLLEQGIEAVAAALIRRDGAGLGVGLAMAKAVAAAHGGHLGIMSEPGGGTEVFLTLPGPADRTPAATVNDSEPLPAQSSVRAVR